LDDNYCERDIAIKPFEFRSNFIALVINKLTYALPAYAGQLTADDKNMINAITSGGLTLTTFDIDTLIDESDRKLSAGHSARSQSAPSSPP